MKRCIPLLLLLLVACSTPRGEPYRPPGDSGPPGTLKEPSAEELERSCELSEVVVRGIVVERKKAPEGESYVVEVQEVLVETASAKEKKDEWPYGVGDSLRISTFLFRPEQAMRRIGPLKAPSRYLFFLAPMERPGYWLNLDDCSGYVLPDADKTLRALRARRDAKPAEGEGREER